MKLKRFAKFIRRNVKFSLISLIVIYFIVAVLTIYHIEDTGNWFDAFRIVLVLFLGEYENFGPATASGKFISIFSLILGVAIVAAFIGRIASIFMHYKKEGKVPKNIKNHIVICNWNKNGDRIIKELHSPQAVDETEIVVIAKSEIEEEELRLNPQYERVFFIRSDPTLHHVLKNARAHLADSVIILASDDCSDPDAKTALIALAITKLEKESPKVPHIVAEVINHDKIQHLLDAGVDEWICSSDYGSGLIAQCAIHKKLSFVYQQLLTYSSDTNEIYMIKSGDYPVDYVGKSFSELSIEINKDRHSNNPVILLGIKRKGKVILNPREHEFDSLADTDSLIVMSFDQPHLKH